MRFIRKKVEIAAARSEQYNGSNDEEVATTSELMISPLIRHNSEQSLSGKTTGYSIGRIVYEQNIVPVVFMLSREFFLL
jgi:hypothetical protein